MKIAVCAGEKSGDALGHELLIDLKKNFEDIEIIGVGGSQMESQGLKSFFPITKQPCSPPDAIVSGNANDQFG